MSKATNGARWRRSRILALNGSVVGIGYAAAVGARFDSTEPKVLASKTVSPREAKGAPILARFPIPL